MHLQRTDVDILLEDLLELAGDVGGVAIHDRCVSVLDLARVVEDNDLRWDEGLYNDLRWDEGS